MLIIEVTCALGTSKKGRWKWKTTICVSNTLTHDVQSMISNIGMGSRVKADHGVDIEVGAVAP
jgi:hypothetical protein